MLKTAKSKLMPILHKTKADQLATGLTRFFIPPLQHFYLMSAIFLLLTYPPAFIRKK